MTRYTDNQYHDAYPDGIETHYWHSSRNRILLNQLDTISFTGIALDVGCGRGMDVMKFREAGYDYHGVEIGNPPPYFAGSEKYLTTDTRSFDLPAEFREQVTLLSFLDVLPCVENIPAFLEAHYEHFPNVRYILAWIVARQEIFSNYDEHVGSLKRYTLQECKHFFPTRNFINLQYCFRLLYPPARFLSMVKMDRGTAIQSPAEGPSWIRTAHSILSQYFVAEAHLLPKSIWGTSIVALVEV